MSKLRRAHQSRDAVFQHRSPNILDRARNYWRMEETGTNDRVDSIGSNDLTPAVTQDTIAGKNNLAANFDASNESLVSTTWRATNWTGFTASAWIKRSDYVSQSTAWILGENAAALPAISLQCYNAGGYVTASLRDSGATIQTAAQPGGSDAGYTLDWVSYIVAWSAGDNVKMYIDGALYSTSSGTLNGPYLEDHEVGLCVGSSQGAGFSWWGGNDGYLDEVAIFDFDIGLVGAQEIHAGGEGLFF